MFGVELAPAAAVHVVTNASALDRVQSIVTPVRLVFMGPAAPRAKPGREPCSTANDAI